MTTSPQTATPEQRDHGGGLDAARERWGGSRDSWLDLSTGINPVPYTMPHILMDDWARLPDKAAQNGLLKAARSFWKVPDGAAILAAPGASALIARIPSLLDQGTVQIETPTYNEHAAAFTAQGWQLGTEAPNAQVVVHPNNPTGRLWSVDDLTAPFAVIDESFCDVTPDWSMIRLADQPGRIVLKSFGKFWGLAGVRLGFAIGVPELIARLADLTGPWAVSGPALTIGTSALLETGWALETRERLRKDSARLDQMMQMAGANLSGGTSLFRLYEVDDAAKWQNHLARSHIWTRIFPYSKTYLRLGLPAPHRWDQVEHALRMTEHEF